MNCKICNRKCEGNYCFIHKPRKVLKKTSKKPENRNKMITFFTEIWNKRKQHNCENCKKWLGSEPLSYMFHHLFKKESFPELKFKEDCIMLICLECHDSETRGFLSDVAKDKIELLKIKYEL